MWTGLGAMTRYGVFPQRWGSPGGLVWWIGSGNGNSWREARDMFSCQRLHGRASTHQRYAVFVLNKGTRPQDGIYRGRTRRTTSPRSRKSILLRTIPVMIHGGDLIIRRSKVVSYFDRLKSQYWVGVLPLLRKKELRETPSALHVLLSALWRVATSRLFAALVRLSFMFVAIDQSFAVAVSSTAIPVSRPLYIQCNKSQSREGLT